MRTAIFLTAALLAAATATASNYREVTRAVEDDAMLATAGVEPAEARVRAQCTAAVVDTDDRPDFFDCVYVQTDHELNLFSLEDGYLMPELQVALGSMDGVALQRIGRYKQVQIFSNGRVAALYIHGKGWIDTTQTESVYRALRERGVPERAPVKWIGP
jgi:hypothetical protein